MTDFICPFTNQSIDRNEISVGNTNGTTRFAYPIQVGTEKNYIRICDSMHDRLIRSSTFYSDNFKTEFDIIRPVIVYRIVLEDFMDIMHWDCELIRNVPGNTILMDLYKEIRDSFKYPKSRKQKAENILLYIEKNQGHTGGDVQMINELSIWGQLFMKNISELIYYIEELERDGLVSYNRIHNTARLTFKGLDHIENSKEINKGVDGTIFSEQYDVGLSFAGEERDYVKQVAEELQANGVKVFYDEYNQSDLWGKDLYQHLNAIYKDKCKFCLVFISENYKKKLWTKHELKAAQTRAFNENTEYILPVRFDDTELEGLNYTTGYLETKDFTPQQIAGMAIEKLEALRKPQS